MDNGSVPPEVSPPASDPDTGPAWGMATNGDSLHHTDRDILLSLGAAVVAQWAGLPRDVQKALFMSASSGPSFDPAATRNHIARFLHDSGNAPLEKPATFKDTLMSTTRTEDTTTPSSPPPGDDVKPANVNNPAEDPGKVRIPSNHEPHRPAFDL